CRRSKTPLMRFQNHRRLYQGWLWPPTRVPGTSAPSPTFVVPMTHELTVDGDSLDEADALGEFIIAAIGFLYGILLIPDGWVHLHRVSVRPTAAHDYLLRNSACDRVIDLAVQF